MLVELLDEEATVRGRRHVARRCALAAVNLGETRGRGRGRGGREVAARTEHARAEQGGRAALTEHSGVGCGEGTSASFGAKAVVRRRRNGSSSGRMLVARTREAENAAADARLIMTPCGLRFLCMRAGFCRHTQTSALQCYAVIHK